MKEIWTRLELLKQEAKNYRRSLRKSGFSEAQISSFLFAVREGIALANTYTDWIPTDVMPPYEAKVLLYLDNDTIQSYTFHYNNKELMQLFKNHVVAWMYQPNKPIFKK